MLFPSALNIMTYLDKMYAPNQYSIHLLGWTTGSTHTRVGHVVYQVVHTLPLMAAPVKSSTIHSAFVAGKPRVSRSLLFLRPSTSERGSNDSVKK